MKFQVHRRNKYPNILLNDKLSQMKCKLLSIKHNFSNRHNAIIIFSKEVKIFVQLKDVIEGFHTNTSSKCHDQKIINL